MQAWNITQNHFADGDGRRNWWNVKPEFRPASMPVAFQLCDDDGEVYYSGRASSDHAVLDALDTIGADAGCTQARVKVDGMWQSLN